MQPTFTPTYSYSAVLYQQFRPFEQTQRFFSTNTDKPKQETEKNEENSEEPPKKLTLMQRFKDAYKVYGKVLIVVHGVTSAAWLGLFYLTAYR